MTHEPLLDVRCYIFNVVLQPSCDSLPTRPHRIDARNHTKKMYNRHATSKGQTERRPMNSYEFQWTGPHGIIHIDSRHARTYTTGTHKHAGSMGRTRQIGWARLGGFNVNRQVSFNNPYMFLAGKRISNKQTPAPSASSNTAS